MRGVRRFIKLGVRLLGNEKILHCMGDSHVQMMEFLSASANTYLFTSTKFKFCIVQGATNMGLANPKSKTQAMPIFLKYLQSVKPNETILFNLGEVDCGFVIWYRAKKHNMSVEQQFSLSLENYYQLIKQAQKTVGNNIIVCSVPLPTIREGQSEGQVANERMEIDASLEERTDLSIQYSNALKEFCSINNLGFLDVTQETLDRNTGVVSERFLNEDPENHHLSNKAVAPILYEKLRALNFK